MDQMVVQPHEDTQRTKIIAVLQAVFVTVLWSSSFVIIKFGLEDIPPLTYAALRYSIASIILLALVFGQKSVRDKLRNRSREWWVSLMVYGIVYITATQGTQFLGLLYLPAITFSLILNLTPIIVLIAAIPYLKEKPSNSETFFVILGVLGVFLYFYPLDFTGLSIIGLVIAVVSLLSNSISSIIGRSINRRRDASPLIITSIMMGIGSLFLMILSLSIEPIVTVSTTSWIYILWLAVVNTALAFTLWNRSMRVLRAIDMTLINSTMMPQIVVLSIIFLGEFPDVMDWIGLIILAVSVTAVQYLQTTKNRETEKFNRSE